MQTRPSSINGLGVVNYNTKDIDSPGLPFAKFFIIHGQCGKNKRGDFWDDCNTDRQRVELQSKNISINFNQKEAVHFYRTKMYLPSKKDLPILKHSTQMIHQVKIGDRYSPLWQVKFNTYRGAGFLTIESDPEAAGVGSHFCQISEKSVPRNKWLEVEIRANYSLYSKKEKKMAAVALKSKGKKGFKAKIKPSLIYAINGEVVCQLWHPLITKTVLRDSAGGLTDELEIKKNQRIFLKYGIYNSRVSNWLIKQEKNQEWIKKNNIRLKPYAQNMRGQSGGVVKSPHASPFDLDWPVQLPNQTIYFSDWLMSATREGLGKTKYINLKELRARPPGCDWPSVRPTLGDQCL